MRLPDQLLAILRAVRAVGRPRLVGGGVRDWLLGLEAKDFDIEVAGADYESLVRVLAPFGDAEQVGREFQPGPGAHPVKRRCRGHWRRRDGLARRCKKT